jgi:hypothetical protein
MASLTYDWLMRRRIVGTNVNAFLLQESCWPKALPRHRLHTTGLILGLALPGLAHASLWLRFSSRTPEMRRRPWKRLWAITPHERLRIRSMLDAIIAVLYGLDENDFRWILRDCDHPIDEVCDKPFSRTLDPKGFWRVDKDKDPELRHTVLSQIAFRDLEQDIAAHGGDRDKGIAAFCARNDGDGWQLPGSLRLADNGLGHDERAKTEQPVASRLGERFLPWQLEPSVEESWRECEVHAKKSLGEEGFVRLMAEIGGGAEAAEARV